MHNSNKIRKTLVVALAGAAMFWFLAMMGLLGHSQPITTLHAISAITSVLVGATWGYLYTRFKSAIVQVSAALGGACASLAWTWGLTSSGAFSWMESGASWQAAIAGFIILGYTGALYFWCPPRD